MRMKNRKSMLQIGVLALVAVLAGGYFTVHEKLNLKNPCADLLTISKEKNLISASEYKENLDLGEWNKTAKVSPSKFPSGIDAFYKFETDGAKENSQEIAYKLSLLFTSVDDDGAIAYVYPHSGASMVDHLNDIFLIQKRIVNQLTIKLVAKKSTGGVAVVTCQNGRKSVISIDLPGYVLQ